MTQGPLAEERPGLLIRTLNAIERFGNMLPDPVTLFIFAIGLVMVLSSVLAGTAAVNPATGKEVAIVNLLEPTQIRRLMTDIANVFASFPPLGVVLTMMIAVGLAERAGFFNAALRSLVKAVPPSLLTFTLVFAGVNSSIASDAGYVVLVPLAAAIFAASGRHPIAGLSAAFAGVAGGWASNLSITTGDGMLAGMTQAAAQFVDPAYKVEITANWFFMASLVPLYALVGTYVCEKIVEPRLNSGPDWVRQAPPEEHPDQDRRETWGLRFAGLAFLLVMALVAWLAWEPGAPLRGAAGTPEAADFDSLFRAMVAIMFLIFLACGIAYGVGSGTIRSDKDAVNLAGKGLTEITPYLVLAFFAAVFVALFSWSNMGTLLAINGANFLKGLGLGDFPLILLLSVILIAMFTDLLIGSASAKWAILAPVLVPMLMLVGVSPEAVQAAYRVGDSTTNMITPFMSYFPLILILARKYRPDFGIGSMIALMLPYTVAFFLASGAFFAAWFSLGIPFGPGVVNHYVLPAQR